MIQTSVTESHKHTGAWKPFRQIDRIYPASIEHFKTRPQVETSPLKQDMYKLAEKTMLHSPYCG